MAKITNFFGEIFFSSLSLSIIALNLLSAASLIPTAFGHFSHLPHYNGGGVGIGNYWNVYQAMDREEAPTHQPAKMSFSIQDYNGNDVTPSHSALWLKYIQKGLVKGFSLSLDHEDIW